MDYLELRKKVIKKYFGQMNDKQFQAVTTVNGPLLVLAGAGSGKTTVLVNRILNLVEFGNAYNSTYIPFDVEKAIKNGEDYLSGAINIPDFNLFSDYPVNSWQILAITFTNKAARELKERIVNKLEDGGNDIWAGTFHSVCGKILRRYASYIGYTSHFTIYDTDDQKKLMKEIMKQNDIDEKFIPCKSVLSAISNAKDSLISPMEYKKSVGNDMRMKIVSDLYILYQNRLKSADAMDFDDMIVKTVELLKENQDVLDYYTNKFRYVMVDEYQDTNHAQYVLVSLLSSGKNNLCVVGDDDQSIYRFRGATIENILNFEDEYRNSVTIRLEQNYRSTSNILNAANAVIKNNRGRKGKTLWTDNGDGSKITVRTCEDERQEARFVADTILENVRNGGKYSDNAVLYRMNAQSNALENVFVRSGISYNVVGGLRFFDRKEIKDVIAYLHLINNNNDDIRLKRIINVPKRAIGNTTVNTASEIAAELGVSLFEVISHADEYQALKRSAIKLTSFTDMIKKLTDKADDVSITELFEEMLDLSSYKSALIAEGEESEDRLENVKEFLSTISQYENENDEPSLSDFLEQIALVSDIDSVESGDDKVILMTIHSAKGLEFENVYLIGLEEGIFPGMQSISAGPAEIEEERRLAYVAITRAKKNLMITNAYSRMMFGTTSRNMPSRFLKEIPDELCDCTGSRGYTLNVRRDDYINRSNDDYQPSVFVKTPKRPTSIDSRPITSDSKRVSYSVGQKVSHNTFGEGLIIKATKMGNDTMLEICFDKVGTKKIMAGYAKLTVL